MTSTDLVTLDDPAWEYATADDGTDDDGNRVGGDRWPGRDGRQARRRLVATLTLRGATQREIANLLGVSKTTVLKDQTHNRGEWQRRSGEAVDQHVARQLHILDRALAFDLSVMEDPARGVEDRQAARNGILANHDRLARLLGLDKPQKIEHSGTIEVEAKLARGMELVEEARRLRAV